MDEDLKIGSIIKKIFGLEQKELILLLFFLAIFIFCIYSLIIILIEEKNLFKQLKKYKIIKKYKQEILLILILPIIFLILVCLGLIEFESWLGFFGGYFGVLGAFGAVWYQKSLDNEAVIKSMELYSDYIAKNVFNILEKNSLELLDVFTNLNGFEEIYKNKDINKIKEEFNIINIELINSNLSIILSNNKFFTLLNLKEKLDNIIYYINKLEKDKTKGNIYTPLITEIKLILKDNEDKEKKQYFLKKYKILQSLKYISENLYYFGLLEFLKFDEKKFLLEHKYLVENILNTFSNKKVSKLEVLKCYRSLFSDISIQVTLISGNIQAVKKIYNSDFSDYLDKVLNLINSMIDIYEDIEKLKSTN